MGKTFNASPEFEKPITKMERFHGILDQDIFLLTLDNTECVIYNEFLDSYKPVIYESDLDNKGKDFVGQPICNTKVAFHGKFFVIGIPSYRALGVFSFNKEEFSCKITKWLDKVSLPL